ncbi:MAG TPA: hypothetical protein VFK05_14035 [Polyangiaceae bacterium]|nr:hypothetical protein [Polyangiaceae bacterium]
MRVRSRSLLAIRLLGIWLSIRAAPAHGQIPDKREPVSSAPAQFVFGSLDCPDPKTVQQAVLNLIPAERHALLARGVRVELEDLGESYRVTVWKDGSSVKKLYSDPARECDGRARFAAVFTVLTLMPPELGAEPVVESKPEPAPPLAKAPTAPEPTAAAPPTPPHAAVLPPFVQLELSALYAYAPAILEAPTIHSFGGELRLALGRGALAGTLSVGYTARAKFELDGVQGELSRIPLSAGVRLRRDFEAWSLSADLGLLLVAERVRASNLLTTEPHASASFGLRAGVQLARQFGPHFAPFLGTFVCFAPSPSELSALPQGVLGNLPYLWLGGAAGVSFGL